MAELIERSTFNEDEALSCKDVSDCSGSLLSQRSRNQAIAHLKYGTVVQPTCRLQGLRDSTFRIPLKIIWGFGSPLTVRAVTGMDVADLKGMISRSETLS